MDSGIYGEKSLTGRGSQRVDPRCHVCGLRIEMRCGVARRRATFLGPWVHLDTAEGMAAEKDHEAAR